MATTASAEKGLFLNSSPNTTVSNDYGSAAYWDERYSQLAHDEVYDWYNSYEALRPHIRKYLAPDDGDLDENEDKEILIAGCGNSNLGAEMYDDGFHNITNIDVSEVVISFMRSKHESREDMEYTVMDIRNMEFIPDDCFDCVIDKALFDSLLCGENNFDNVQRAVREVYRTLKPGGRYIMVSHGPPNTRMHHLNPSSIRWDVEVLELEKPELLDKSVMKKGAERGPNHFIYICRK